MELSDHQKFDTMVKVNHFLCEYSFASVMVANETSIEVIKPVVTETSIQSSREIMNISNLWNSRNSRILIQESK